MKVKEILKDCSEWLPGMATDSPLVSIVLPIAESAESEQICDAIQSVIHQSFESWELIIIDDTSEEEVSKLIQRFMEQDERISCIRHRFSVGLPAISEYEGIVRSHGAYIAFLFANTEWEKSYLSQTIDFMEEHKAKAAYGCMRIYYSHVGMDFLETGHSNGYFGINSLPAKNYISNGAVVLAREVLFHPFVGLYDPHIVMTKQCDWLLWRRLTRYFQFCETGILAGNEWRTSPAINGETTDEENPWIYAERENQVIDTDIFSVENFPNIEIDDTAESATPLYKGAVYQRRREFAQKPWFKPSASESTSTAQPPKRILVLAIAFDATIGLSFLRLEGQSNHFIFRYGDTRTPDWEILYADAVILMRDSVTLKHYKDVCDAADIPCWYYTDDNFAVLCLDYCSTWMACDKMVRFSGVLTSTDSLRDYFAEHALNQNVLAMDHVFLPRNCPESFNCSEKVCRNKITIAFLGGAWRNATFVQYVVPALRHISKQIPIRLLCSTGVDLKKWKNVKDLEIVQMAYCRDFDSLLIQYREYAPDILIHCGEYSKNCLYKTENAVYNAAALGAALVASNVAPYSGQDERPFVRVENSASAWENALLDLIKDKNHRERLYQQAKEYSLSRYSASGALSSLEQAFQKVQPLSDFGLVERIQNMLNKRLSSPAASAITKKSRSLVETTLHYAGGVRRSRKYKIRCIVPTFSELGICFATLGNASGNIRVEIWDKSGKLRDASLNMEHFVHDNWSYFRFDPITNAYAKTFEIRLYFEYEKGSDRMGVFEDAERAGYLTHLSHLTSRFDLPLPITDLLFADCR